MARDKHGRFKKGSKGGPGRPKKRNDAAEVAPNMPVRGDSFRADGIYNKYTGHGVAAKDARRATTFEVDVVTVPEAIDLWRGNDLAARIVETIPGEMTRAGWDLKIQTEKDRAEEKELKDTERDLNSIEITSEEVEKRRDAMLDRVRVRLDALQRRRLDKIDPDVKALTETIKTRTEELGLDEALRKATEYERAYGGGAILLGANDGSKDLRRPLDPEKVRSLDWLTVLEPDELTPRYYYADPRAPKYGEVAIWQLTPIAPGHSEKGTPFVTAPIEVHESRLIIFGGIRVTKRHVTPLAGWGDSVLTKCREVLMEFGLSFSSASALTVDFSQGVIKIRDLAKLYASDKQGTIHARLADLALGKSTINTMLLDAEGEDYERKATPMTGLADILDRFWTRLAAAADMPVTLLSGQSPAGLNATGESDIRFFYDRVAAQREKKLLSPIEMIVGMLLRIEGGEPENWSIAFRPLWQQSDEEQATARKTQAETDNLYITSGVLAPEEVARSRFGGDEYSFETIVDFDNREELERLEAKEEEKAMKELEIEKELIKTKQGPPPTEEKPPGKPAEK